MAETIVSKVRRGAKLESRGAKHPLAPLRSACIWYVQIYLPKSILDITDYETLSNKIHEHLIDSNTN